MISTSESSPTTFPLGTLVFDLLAYSSSLFTLLFKYVFILFVRPPVRQREALKRGGWGDPMSTAVVPLAKARPPLHPRQPSIFIIIQLILLPGCKSSDGHGAHNNLYKRVAVLVVCSPAALIARDTSDLLTGEPARLI